MMRMEAKNTGNNLISKSTSQHPLQIAVIIRTILEFLPFKMIKSSRLVCQTWNNECVSILRKKSHWKIYIHNPRDHNQFIRNHVKLQDINSGKYFPCQRFKIDFHYEFPPTPLRNLEENIVELYLHFWCNFKIYDNFSKHLGSFPSLKSLSIRQDSDSFGTISSVYNNLPFLQKILELAPKLKNVELESRASNVLQLFIDLLSATKPFHEITSLSLIGCIVDSHMMQLSRLGFPLQQLKLCFIKASLNSSENSMQTLLATLKDSLQNLELRYDVFLNVGQTFMKLPQLSKLASFAVSLTENDNMRIPQLRNFSYSQQLPSLKNLALDYNSEDIQQFFKPSSSVEQLTINLKNCTIDESLRIHWKVFPNVKYLRISSFTKSMQSLLPQLVNVILTAWPNLEGLNIRINPHDIDQTILGISKSEYKILLNKLKDGEDFENLETLYANTHAPLSCLKRLKTLEFGTYGFNHASEAQAWTFTDLACRLVLLKMKSLDKIIFHDMLSIDRISEPVRCQMRKKFTRWC